jgi:hypothetical protein
VAGDWIKMRVDLSDDPAVVMIAARCGISEDEVVGKLHKLWCWADRHTTDGTAPGITATWVNRYVGRSGFAEAMQAAEWLEFTDTHVAFPHFEKHNGKSAKQRAEATVRQRLSRENRDSHETGTERHPIPAPFTREVMHRDAFTCVYCGTVSTEAKERAGPRFRRLSIDHITPAARGGRSAIDNLVTACIQCNSEKNDRTPEEWGLLPTFLQKGVVYADGRVTGPSHVSRDRNATREEKRRSKTPTPTPSPAGKGDGRKHSANGQTVANGNGVPKLPQAWWSDPDKAKRAGDMLGLAARPGELLPEFTRRVNDELERRKQQAEATH